MTKTELALWLSRCRELFPLGAENLEVWAAFTTRLTRCDSTRALQALEDYAIASSGPGRKFVPGIFQDHFARLPDVEDSRRVHVECAERFEREAARDRTYERIREERDVDRRAVLTANPLKVGEIVDQLVGWGAPRPPAHPEAWPSPWYMAVADILGDRQRAAPTEHGYYEQVRDHRGVWVDDPTKPLRLVPAAEWWRAYGVAGLRARGVLAAG